MLRYSSWLQGLNRTNNIIGLILLASYLYINNIAWGTMTVSEDDYTVEQDDNTGLLIFGSGQTIKINDNVTLTNTVGDNIGDVVTGDSMVQGSNVDGELNPLTGYKPSIVTQIDIGENANIIANDNYNAINMGSALKTGSIVINNRGNIIAQARIVPIIYPNIITDDQFINENQAITFFDATPNLELHNYGTIVGGIAGSRFNDIIHNMGTITGNIYGSQGNDVIYFDSGKIDGRIDGGSGDNTLEINNNFDTYGNIFSIGNIKVNSGNFNIRHPITEVNTILYNKGVVNLESPGVVTGKGNIYNEGNIVVNVSAANALEMQDIHNNGNISINNTGAGGVILEKIVNNSDATVTLYNEGINGITITEICNQDNARLDITNTTATPADVNVDFLGNNSGVLNLSGAIQIKQSPQITNQPNAKINFLDPGVEIAGATNIINNGIVEVFAPTDLGGSYTVGDQATHIIHINDGIPATISSQGAAKFSNSAYLQIVNDAKNLLVDGQTIKIIEGTEEAQALDYSNVSVKVTSPSIVLNYRAYNEGTSILLGVSKKPYDTLLSDPTPNIITVAKTLSGLANSPNIVNKGLRSSVLQLDQASSNEKITYDVDQLIPDLSVIHAGNSSMQSASASFNQINDRILQLAKLEQGDLLNSEEQGYSAGDSAGDSAVDDLANRHIWLKGFNIHSNQKALIETNGYKAKLLGLAVGADHRLNSNFILGASFSYANTKANSKDQAPDRNNLNAYQVTLYSNYTNSRYYLNGYLAAGFNSYKTVRIDNSSGSNATWNGNFNGIQPGLKFDFGLPKMLNNIRITPNFSLEYLYLHQQQYNEQGTGANLQEVKSKDINLLKGGAGVRLELLQTGKFKNFMPELRIMGWYDAINTIPQITTKFQGGGQSFALTGDRNSKATLNLGLGLNYVNSKGIVLNFNYDLFAKKKFVAHSGSILVKYII